ncbi:MAG: hypothetical protein IH840_08925 [Candidatus Heimdallarchaeota archaeon]|nr:hypothetical protein [Candidatus Heimdallarchaeota archaeon]
MLKEATLVSNTGIPIWVRSTGPSMVSGILAGAMLGALSMFSAEVTGQVLRSVEMSEGFKLHIRPFGSGDINLAIIGDDNILSDPELLKIIASLDDDINLMYSQVADVDLNDTKTTSVYLESSIILLDSWFGSRVFVQTAIQKAHQEQIVEVSSQLTIMASRFLQENIAILILDPSLEALYMHETDKLNENVLGSLQTHLRGWIKTSSHTAPLLPELMFFKDYCVGIKALNRFYIICALEWSGSMGNIQIVGKIRSWLSTLGRRFA